MNRRHPLDPRRLAATAISDGWRKLAALVIAVLLWVWIDQYGVDERTFTYAINFEQSVERPTDSPGSEDDRRLSETDAAEQRRIASGRLTVFFDLDNYALDFENRPRGTEISITFRGANRDLPLASGTPPPLVAYCRVEEDGDQFAVVLDADTIRHRSAVHRDLSIATVPESLLIRVIPRETRSVKLAPSQIELATNTDSRIDPSSLRWDRAEFTPPSVMVNAPISVLEELELGAGSFYFRPTNVSPQAPLPRVLEGTLQPRDLRVRPLVAIDLRVPRAEPSFETLLSEVPVILHQPAEAAGRFVPRNDRVNVPVRVFGLLKSRLESMDAEEKARWTQETALLVARVPPDATGADVITKPRLLLGSEFREGTDFELTVPLTIDFRPKTP